jgi:hypothetical protein
VIHTFYHDKKTGFVILKKLFFHYISRQILSLSRSPQPAPARTAGEAKKAAALKPEPASVT